MILRTGSYIGIGLLALANPIRGEEWPGWRGPGRDGLSAGTPPLREWSEQLNVRWRAPVPGRGHSSPVIAAGKVFLTTAYDDDPRQGVLAFDAESGRLLWEKILHRGGLEPSLSRQASHASASVAWDDGRIFAAFLNQRAIHVSALDAEGRVLWQKKVSDYVTVRAYGGSPLIHGDLVIINADHKEGGRIVALEKTSGRERWVLERGKFQNYPSPVIFNLNGVLQLITAGGNKLTSVDPESGRILWEVDGPTETTVTTPVTDGRAVFVTGGFPRSHVSAIAADGKGGLLWQSGSGIYVPSMLVVGGALVGLQDTGRVVVWRADDGEELWREKLDREFFSSPVLAGGFVYATALSGVTYVLKGSGTQWSVVARNQLGDEAFASPAVAGGRMYLRHARQGERREEFLWCVGK